MIFLVLYSFILMFSMFAMFFVSFLLFSCIRYQWNTRRCPGMWIPLLCVPEMALPSPTSPHVSNDFCFVFFLPKKALWADFFMRVQMRCFRKASFYGGHPDRGYPCSLRWKLQACEVSSFSWSVERSRKSVYFDHKFNTGDKLWTSDVNLFINFISSFLSGQSLFLDSLQIIKVRLKGREENG